MISDLVNALKKTSSSKQFPDGKPYFSLPLQDINRLSNTFDLSTQHVEIAALEADIIPEHYARNMRFFSTQDQIVLLKSQVAIVGLGGLGGTVTEILTRTGIGHLILIDGDKFEESNLNRQFLSRIDLLEKPKADAAKHRVGALNPSISCNVYAEFLTEANAHDLLSGSDVIVDCLDSIETRFVLENAAKKLGIPFVSAAVAGFSGQVTVIFPEDEGLKQIYGASEEDRPSKGAEATLGTLAPAVTTVAALECAEVVKILFDRGATLRNKLMIIDLLDNIFEVLDV